ncbi:HAD family phosphatase [Alkaliphilus pronyensis]|uniref:HAD family phosphatase n=1 Tax=Alkaliphilus pronyensis TaxID=1482732 RepID=A0A6I0F973_9FIRM|nr:Cof-type HAD-IIB family hydrolase [Alkaliphilus pronyensis]KAB3535334.1 HAD family phosphatase [Alkaliphilus pronyensis]
MVIKMLATDMDGTLLKNNKTLSTNNIKALKKAQEKGIEIVICTGRPYATIKPYLKEIGFPCWVVSNNGAVIRNKEKEIINIINIDNRAILDLIPILEKENIYFHGSDGCHSYIKSYRERIKVIKNYIKLKSSSHFTTWTKSLHAVFLSGAHRKVDMRKYVLSGGTFASLFIYSLEPKQLENTKSKIKNVGGIAITSSGRENIEILHESASKGNALKKLSQQLNISTNEIAAVGDNYNDLSMISIAGLGVAMENAEEEVLKSAKWRTKSNEDDGVSYLIERILSGDLTIDQGVESK